MSTREEEIKIEPGLPKSQTKAIYETWITNYKELLRVWLRKSPRQTKR